MPVWYHLLCLEGCFVFQTNWLDCSHSWELNIGFSRLSIQEKQNSGVISNRQKQLLETVLGVMHWEQMSQPHIERERRREDKAGQLAPAATWPPCLSPGLTRQRLLRDLCTSHGQGTESWIPAWHRMVAQDTGAALLSTSLSLPVKFKFDFFFNALQINLTVILRGISNFLSY